MTGKRGTKKKLKSKLKLEEDFDCGYCLNSVSEFDKHKQKCFLHKNNTQFIKKYLINCVLTLHRPSCQHMTKWLNDNNADVIKPRTLLNASKYESFDELLFHYINELIKTSNNIELEFLLIVRNWLSLDKKVDMVYNQEMYNQEVLFNKRVNFFKKILDVSNEE